MTIAQDTAPPPDPAAFTVAQMAALLGVSARRIRQLRENGELIARGRGLIDLTHGIHAAAGARALGRENAAAGAFTKAAAGWLMAYEEAGVRPADLVLWFDTASGWGLDEAEAAAALFNAGRLLGETGPVFHGKAAPKAAKKDPKGGK